MKVVCRKQSFSRIRVIEKTTPAMVIIEPAIVPRTKLAPSLRAAAVRQPRVCSRSSGTTSSRATVAKANATAEQAMSEGRNRSWNEEDPSI